jgi:hypothetical protein
MAMGDHGLIDVVDGRQMLTSQRQSTEVGAHTTALDGERQLRYAFLPRTSRAAVYREISRA